MRRKLSRQKMTSIVSALLLLINFLVPGFAVHAEGIQPVPLYLSLGDSIGYGLSAAPKEGYADQFYGYLKNVSQYEGLQFLNAAVPGYKTSDLLGLLKTSPQAQAVLPTSKVITVSIGGNNLLGPVMAKARDLFNVQVPISDPNFENQLKAAMAVDPAATKLKLAGLATDVAFFASLTQGALDFASDWAQIVPALKTAAPSAKLYVLTVYNPLNTTDPLYTAFETLMTQINYVIKAGSQSYTVVDVHDLIKNHIGEPAVNFNFATLKLDPHPSQLGHNMIFDALITHTSSIVLDKTSASMKPGDTLNLSCTVAPQNTTNRDVVWSSSNPAVAEVDANGKVTAKANGTAKITAVSEDNNKIASECAITVATLVSGVALDKTQTELNALNELQLNASLTPASASNQSLTWTSSDNDIATVDGSGKVKSVKAGTAVITVTTADGAKTASCTITVTAAALPQTGQAIDFTLLATIGLILTAAGFFIVFPLRKRQF
jgi:LPXTG-motif cell wall-anchored protein